MGSTLSNQVGYGLMIPYTDEEYAFEGAPDEWVALLDKYDGDTREVFKELLKDYPHLSWESSYFQDYSGPSVIFVDTLTSETYGVGPLRVVDKIMYAPETYEYDKQLLEISRTIGMSLKDAADGLGLWSVVSYG